jgi:hypothetical protein
VEKPETGGSEVGESVVAAEVSAISQEVRSRGYVWCLAFRMERLDSCSALQLVLTP